MSPLFWLHKVLELVAAARRWRYPCESVAKPEQPLWEFLEERGFLFRCTKRELIERFGPRPSGWSDGLSYCELPTQPALLDGLAHPFVFQFLEDADLTVHATTFFGYLRGSPDTMENFQAAESQLTKLFGPGQDNSLANTRCRYWKFGRAYVRAIVWPQELNRLFARNVRHERIPGSETECLIELDTAWRRPLTEAEHRWLRSYKSRYRAPHEAHQFRFSAGLTRDWPEDCDEPPPGFGFDARGEAVLHVGDASVNVLPVSWIEEVENSCVLPAKGPGGDYLSLIYRPQGQSGTKRTSLTIATQFHRPHFFDELASQLAQSLGVQLRVNEDYDS